MIRNMILAALVILGTPAGLFLAYDALLLRSTSTPITLYDFWVCMGAAILIVLLEAWALSVLLRGQFSRRRKLKCITLTFSVLAFLLWQVSVVLELGNKWPNGLWLVLSDGCLEAGVDRSGRNYTWTVIQMPDHAPIYSWDRLEWWPRAWRYRSGVWIAVRIPLWMVYLAMVILTIVMFWRCRRFPPGHCHHCSYDLTGNLSGVCPECGTKISLASSPEP